MANEWLQDTLAQLHAAALKEQLAGQEELQSVNEELMTVNTPLSAAEVALLLQSMGEGMIGVAGDGRCSFVNAAGAALLG